MQLDWGTEFSNGGNLSLSLLATILDQYAESPFPGAEFVDFTGTEENSSFDYRTFTTVNYNQDAWAIGLRWEHMPSLDTIPGASADRFGVDSYNIFDLFANWLIGDTYILRAGIDNLVNKDPVVVGRTSTDNNLGSTNPNYDPFGRRFYLGFSIGL